MKRYTEAEVREQIVTAFKLGMKIGRMEERRAAELDRATVPDETVDLAPVVPLRPVV